MFFFTAKNESIVIFKNMGGFIVGKESSVFFVTLYPFKICGRFKVTVLNLVISFYAFVAVKTGF